MKGARRHVFVRMVLRALTLTAIARVLLVGPGFTASDRVLTDYLGLTALVCVAVPTVVGVIIEMEHALVLMDGWENSAQRHVRMASMVVTAQWNAPV